MSGKYENIDQTIVHSIWGLTLNLDITNIQGLCLTMRASL